MATTFAPQIITLSNEVCDSMKIPRETQITLSRMEIEQKIKHSREEVENNTLFTIPDDLYDLVKVSSGTKMSRREIENFGKKFVRENHYIDASWNRLIFNNYRTSTDVDTGNLSKLFRLRALIKPEAYPLPDELCELLQIPMGLPMNRFDLENQVSEYIHSNMIIKNKNNDIIIHCDHEKLRKVFALPEGTEEISYDDLMMKINAYFVEKVQFSNTLKGPSMEIPYVISNELADFLEVAHDTQMSLSEAIRCVAKYTFANTLQVWDCKKNSFTPDEKLRNLLSLPEDDGKRMEITYEALETHVKKHLVGSA